MLSVLWVNGTAVQVVDFDLSDVQVVVPLIALRICTTGHHQGCAKLTTIC